MKLIKTGFNKPSIETERKNIREYRAILPDFMYTNTSVNRLRKTTRPLTRPHKHCYADRAFGVNARDLRVWYKLTVDAEDDRAYMEYLKCMYAAAGHPYVYKYNLRSYEVFKSGRVKAGKQEIKLFKFILSNGILPQPIVERITAMKNNNNGDVWLCISRNPVDLMFCSTNQPYSSCMSLESDCSYWLAAAALAGDPNRAIAFVTRGELSRYNVRGFNFHNFRYLQRNFIHLVNQDKIYVDRDYPCSSYDMRDLLEAAGYRMADRGKRQSSRFHFIPARIMNPGSGSDVYALPYFDYIGYRIHRPIKRGLRKTRCTLDTWDGNTGCPFDFPFNGGLENLNELEDLLEENGDYIDCENCGDRVHMDDAFTGPQDSWYCAGCFNDLFRSCGHCGDMDRIEDMHGTADDGLVCGYCLDTHYVECYHCSEIVHSADTEEVDGETYCMDCFEDMETAECPVCGELAVTDDDETVYNGKPHCFSCFDSRIEKAHDMMPFFHRKKQVKNWNMYVSGKICFADYLHYKNNFEYAA